jgi:hypothetical protein
MKNIIDICKDFGLEIPADKHADFLKAVNGEYKTIAEHNKVLDKLSTATKRAETAEETLKGFEGKDFDAITRDRDEWKKKHDEAVADYKRQQEDREFNSALENAISEAKGKNAKAIMALLDTEKLRGSRNMEKDIKSALDALRTDSGYLFEDNGGKPQFSTNKSNPGNPSSLTREDIMKIPDRAERRAAMAKNQHLFTKGE